jgi:medium-chain acyl-[acyl-carrier-protein] hydrolase
MRLFCFPYAGRGADLFASWSGGLPAGVDLCPVQLPGRGGRLCEPPLTECHALVSALLDAIDVTDLPFALFGHSMGAILSFELARRYREKGLPGPVHLFVSGAGAPHALRSPKRRPELCNEDLLRELSSLNGTPPEILQNADLMELFLPLLRADFSVCDLYQYREAPRLDCPITAFCGTDDPEASVEQTAAWAQQTDSSFRLHVIPGDHFFINQQLPRMLQLLSHELERCCRETAACPSTSGEGFRP